jgi:hypothetical protein
VVIASYLSGFEVRIFTRPGRSGNRYGTISAAVFGRPLLTKE